MVTLGNSPENCRDLNLTPKVSSHSSSYMPAILLMRSAQCKFDDRDDDDIDDFGGGGTCTAAGNVTGA